MSSQLPVERFSAMWGAMLLTSPEERAVIMAQIFGTQVEAMLEMTWVSSSE